MAADATKGQIIDLAHYRGWRVASFDPMKDGDGRYRVPVGADGKGWPDLVMVHPALGIIFAECKGRSSDLEPAQREWRNAIVAAGGRWYLWRPVHIIDGTVERVLTGHGNAPGR